MSPSFPLADRPLFLFPHPNTMYPVVGTDGILRWFVEAVLRGNKTFLPSLEVAEFVGNAAFEVEMPFVIAVFASRS